MARLLPYLAQDIMNLYNQDYKSTTDFFDLDDFISYTGMAYADFLSKEYDAERNRMRQEGEENTVVFSHDWQQEQIVKVEYNENDGHFAKLLQKPMSFPFDKWDSGIQNVYPIKSQFKNEILRDNINAGWMDAYLPIGCTHFWSLLGDKLLINANGKQPPKELKVIYIPTVSDNLEIPDSREKMVMDATLQMMNVAAQKIVKETNDQNLNKNFGAEINRELAKP